MNETHRTPMPPELADLSAQLFGDAPEIAPLQPAVSYPHVVVDLDMIASGELQRWHRARDLYVARYGYVLLSAECADRLTTLLRGHNVLDAGSGLGYLAHTLTGRGVAVTALERDWPGAPWIAGHDKPWQLDQMSRAEDALPGTFDAVLLCWPDRSSNLAHAVASRMRPGQMLVYCGETEGGCCASGAFFRFIRGGQWELLEAATSEINASHAQFMSMHDEWLVVRRR